MELTEGIYEIVPECRATIVDKGRKVQIFKRKVKYTGPRCQDCAHCHEGKLTMQDQWWVNHHCELKPKTIAGKQGYFYAVRPEAPACGCPGFELKV